MLKQSDFVIGIVICRAEDMLREIFSTFVKIIDSIDAFIRV